VILDNLNYFFYGICFFIAFAFLVWRNEKKHFSFVKKHWFYTKTYASKIRLLFYLIGFMLLGISLLDIRGKQNKILTSSPSQKTLVLIDCSLSMKVKDVYPDRLGKGVLFARKIIKKLKDHRIALMAFSDKSDVLVPFTDDLHIINSRLDLIEKLNIVSGSSNLNQSIQEGINYVQANNEVFNSINNILVITDGDLHDSKFKITEQDELNVAILTVGSLSGGPVPKFDKEGNYLSPKTYKGKGIISISNRNYFSKLQEDYNNLKVWSWYSGGGPFLEILEFFKYNFKSSLEKRTRYSREIISHWIASLGVVFLILAFFSSFYKSFNKVILLALLFSNLNVFTNARAEDLFEKLKKGNASRIERLKLAEIFLKEGKLDFSKYLYEENLKGKLLDNEFKIIFNYGTLYLKKGNFEKGLMILDELKKQIENQSEDGLLVSINSNIIFAIKNFVKNKKSNNEKVNIVNKKIKKPIRNKKTGTLSELKTRNLKKSNKDNNGIILNIINEDQNLQKMLVKINILNKRKRLNQKDW
tara:strand:- start:1605 stop:3191 length:1587 start_codon:yes stop_codon:yes gene_type:complete